MYHSIYYVENDNLQKLNDRGVRPWVSISKAHVKSDLRRNMLITRHVRERWVRTERGFRFILHYKGQ
jgi:hypothetical protein